MSSTRHAAFLRMFTPAVLGLTVALAAPAHAETTQCTAITSLPTIITVRGIYCLTSDFTLNLSSGAAIVVDANNVVIDLNGHTIGNLAAGTGTMAFGIASGRQNITIKNGTIRGFIFGVHLEGDGHVVEDLRADRNTRFGIEVNGRGNLVRRNQVVSTGGTTAFMDPDIVGIFIDGLGNRVIDNDVITVTPTGSALGYGVYSTDGIVLDNRISFADVGIIMSSNTKYRDNLTTGVTTPYLGGINAGNNN